MALSGSTVWEVRTGGDDDNGGGFVTGASGTDYSQQDATQLTLSDLATSGIGVTTLTSATGGFTAEMIGNILNLKSGTNATVDLYEITAHTDTNTVTLDRAPDDGVGGVSGGTGSVGGALGSPGKLSDAIQGSANGMIAWVESGTYVLTTTAAGAGGPLVLALGTLNYSIKGYDSARGDLEGIAPTITDHPIMDSAALTSFTMVSLISTGDGQIVVSNLITDGNDGSGVDGFVGQVQGRSLYMNCRSIGCADGFRAGDFTFCIAESCVKGFDGNSTLANDCVAFGCSNAGFDIQQGVTKNCLAYENVIGFNCGNFHLFLNCTSVDNTNDGFHTDNQRMVCVECVSTHNGGYGYGGGSGEVEDSKLIHCFGTNNTSGNIENESDWFEIIAFENFGGAVDPWVDRSTDDYRPDDTAGEGALIRGGSWGLPGQTNNQNIGALQHADPAASAPFFIKQSSSLLTR